jgi:hypothetical protein
MKRRKKTVQRKPKESDTESDITETSTTSGQSIPNKFNNQETATLNQILALCSQINDQMRHIQMEVKFLKEAEEQIQTKIGRVENLIATASLASSSPSGKALSAADVVWLIIKMIFMRY